MARGRISRNKSLITISKDFLKLSFQGTTSRLKKRWANNLHFDVATFAVLSSANSDGDFNAGLYSHNDKSS